MPEPPTTRAAPPAYSQEVDLALALASIVHRRAERKGTRVPYIVHPLHVTLILSRHGLPEHVQVAGILHDVLEDIDPSDAAVRMALAETFHELAPHVEAADDRFRRAVAGVIEGRFSARVRDLVDAMTQQKRGPDGEMLPIQERRLRVVEKVAASDDPEFVSLKAADAVHNARSIVGGLLSEGAGVMSRFKGPAGETIGYFEALADVVSDRLGESHPMATELRMALGELRETFERTTAAGRADATP
jgi:(p)ppGpp synthase/HD superfamily hydrolase